MPPTSAGSWLAGPVPTGAKPGGLLARLEVEDAWLPEGGCGAMGRDESHHRRGRSSTSGCVRDSRRRKPVPDVDGHRMPLSERCALSGRELTATGCRLLACSGGLKRPDKAEVSGSSPLRPTPEQPIEQPTGRSVTDLLALPWMAASAAAIRRTSRSRLVMRRAGVFASLRAASRGPRLTRPSMARPCLLPHAEAEHSHGT
jgi:hypothetical protein